jgi:Dyp-type peroxidase family
MQLTPNQSPMLNQFDPANRDFLDGIQGNILKAHGRHHTANLFLHCRDNQQVAVRKWLHDLVDGEDRIVHSAYAQLRSNALWKDHQVDSGLFACVHISAAGYDYLLGEDAKVRFRDAAFVGGMRSAKDRLTDPDTTDWAATDPHLMLLLAHAEPKELTKALAKVQAQIAPFANVTIEPGAALLNAEKAGIEHFGYVDGISQPLFFADELAQYQADNNVQPGQPMAFDPSATPALVLTPDPFGGDGALGSYFVFRKLEQNVRRFKESEQQVADDLHLTGEDQERAGAMLVGRFEDGTPVQLFHEAGLINSAVLNNFDYDSADASRCPFHAHVRKTNPRSGLFDGSTPFADPTQAMTEAKRHIMARRGITYGTRADDLSDRPTDGVGLLFMSYQASIAGQFEVIQRDWANSSTFPGDDTDPNRTGYSIGNDPVIGQGAVSKGQLATIAGNPATMQPATFAQCVTLKGGEYFFAPSLSFLRSL